jgi:hypothetical protein
MVKFVKRLWYRWITWRWLRDQRRALAAVPPHVLRYQMGVSAFDGPEAFDAARSRLVQRIETVAAVAKLLGVRPDQVAEQVTALARERARGDALRAELEILKGKENAAASNQ